MIRGVAFGGSGLIVGEEELVCLKQKDLFYGYSTPLSSTIYYIMVVSLFVKETGGHREKH